MTDERREELQDEYTLEEKTAFGIEDDDESDYLDVEYEEYTEEDNDMLFANE